MTTQEELPLPLVQLAAASTPFLVLGDVVGLETADRAEAVLARQVLGQGRKFSKPEALYLPGTPFPPVAYRYECQTCRFFEPAGTNRRPYATCAIVGEPEDALGGEAIGELAWCGFFLQAVGDPPFRWLANLVAPQIPRKPEREGLDAEI
jgi:hypothetical protein